MNSSVSRLQRISETILTSINENRLTQVRHNNPLELGISLTVITKAVGRFLSKCYERKLMHC